MIIIVLLFKRKEKAITLYQRVLEERYIWSQVKVHIVLFLHADGQLHRETKIDLDRLKGNRVY